MIIVKFQIPEIKPQSESKTQTEIETWIKIKITIKNLSFDILIAWEIPSFSVYHLYEKKEQYGESSV